MSKVIQREISLNANEVRDNILSGSAFEFLPGPSIVSIGVTAAATGLQVTIQAGGVSVLEESPPLIKTAFPSTEDDMYYQFGGISGDRLVVRVRNTTAGAVVVRVLVMVQPAR